MLYSGHIFLFQADLFQFQSDNLMAKAFHSSRRDECQVNDDPRLDEVRVTVLVWIIVTTIEEVELMLAIRLLDSWPLLAAWELDVMVILLD